MLHAFPSGFLHFIWFTHCAMKSWNAFVMFWRCYSLGMFNICYETVAKWRDVCDGQLELHFYTLCMYVNRKLARNCQINLYYSCWYADRILKTNGYLMFQYVVKANKLHVKKFPGVVMVTKLYYTSIFFLLHSTLELFFRIFIYFWEYSSSRIMCFTSSSITSNDRRIIW